MKTKPEPTLTLTFHWSGEVPKKIKSEVKRLFAALEKPKTFKLKIR